MEKLCKEKIYLVQNLNSPKRQLIILAKRIATKYILFNKYMHVNATLPQKSIKGPTPLLLLPLLMLRLCLCEFRKMLIWIRWLVCAKQMIPLEILGPMLGHTKSAVALVHELWTFSICVVLNAAFNDVHLFMKIVLCTFKFDELKIEPMNH